MGRVFSHGWLRWAADGTEEAPQRSRLQAAEGAEGGSDDQDGRPVERSTEIGTRK